MSNLRLIARLDIKAPNLIKGVHLEGLRVIGDPQTYAQKYYQDGIDELVYMDIVASLYNRNHLDAIIRRAAQEVFIPITVGGGIRSLEDATHILKSGADKVAINTACVKRPELINEMADRFGSQCMVLSIEAKRCGEGRWEVYHDNGREHTGKDVVAWALEAQRRGAGEILLTSVDREGTRKGFDIELIKAVSTAVSIPVIASGGMGCLEDLHGCVVEGKADAVAMADVLHYRRLSVPDIRQFSQSKGLPVRHV